MVKTDAQGGIYYDSLPLRGDMRNINNLTLKAPITTAADDKFSLIFPNF